MNNLRKFGIIIGMALIIFGLLNLRHEGHAWNYFFAAAAIFIFLGAALPGTLRPVYKVWMALAVIMGFIMTRFVLFALFYLVVTPIGILSRIFGRDFMDTRLDRTAMSYWARRKKIEFNRSNYEKQF